MASSAGSKKLVLILGGARSGKSSYAERLAAELAGTSGNVLYAATAEALDDEMAVRIARHRTTRPAAWRTLEEPRALAAAIERACGDATVVLVDCMTLWISNLLAGLTAPGSDAPDQDEADTTARQEVGRLLAVHARGTANTILVSNEVGMGLVPPYPLGRVYRDVLGRVNMQLADAADDVVLLVAGVPLPLK